MNWLVVLLLLTAIAVGIPASALVSRRLSWRRDYFLLLLYVQFLIYLHLAPTMWAFDLTDEMQGIYAYLEAGCILLFEVPFLLLYLRRVRGLDEARRGEGASLLVDRGRLFRAALLSGAFALAFLVVSLRGQLFYSRLGFEGSVSALSTLSLPEFAIYRLFQLSGAFVVGTLVAVTIQSRRNAEGSSSSRIVRAATILTGSIFLINQVFNSRLRIAISLAILVGLILYFERSDYLTRNGMKVVLIGIVLGVIGVRLARNVRYIYPEHGVSWAMLNPFLSWDEPDEVEGTGDFAFRLNGIDLMARITPAARRQGFAMGDAWKGAAAITLGQLSLGRLVSSESIADIKESFGGSPKRYLMGRYLDLDWPDYSSSVLTDAYGNFGLFGLPLVAVILAVATAYVTRSFSLLNSPRGVLVSIFLLFPMLLFEQELAALFMSWINSLPVLIVGCWLNPFKVSVTSRSLPAGSTQLKLATLRQ